MKPPAFQFYADDFLAGTITMTNEERGLYITLLCRQWSQGFVSRDDIARLCLAMAQPSVDHVLAKFKQGKDDLLRNDRMESERQKQASFRANRSESGKLGADKRWHSHSTAIAQPMAKHSSPSPSPSPSPISREREREPDLPEIPDWRSVEAYASRIGLVEWKAKDWFDEMEGSGWLDHLGRRICKWSAVLNRVKAQWEADGRPLTKPGRKFTPSGERPKSALDLKTIIQAKEATATTLRAKHCSDVAMGAVWNNEVKRQEYFKLKKEIKKLTEQIGNMA